MSLVGGLDLRAEAGGAQTFLRRQIASPPFHVSKPHWDGAWLVTNLASPVPGLLAGDRVRIRVEVESEARLVLATPSATRIHKMRRGHAELEQEYHVARGGWLALRPEYLIPQAESRYRQRSVIRVEEGGSLIWTELVAPGRTARGECFEFDELELKADLFHGSRQLLRERYRLERGSAAIAALRRRFDTAYYASLLCVSPRLEVSGAVLGELTSLHQGDAAWVGASRLSDRAITMKVVASDSPTLRRTVDAALAIIHRAVGMPLPELRRATGESPSGAGYIERAA